MALPFRQHKKQNPSVAISALDEIERLCGTVKGFKAQRWFHQ